MTIHIDQSSCISCGRCMAVCPAIVFKADKDNNRVIKALRPENCIGCGHCIDACPKGCIEHSLFPLEKQHTIERDMLPTADQLKMLMSSRRSMRNFKSEPVPHETLLKIVHAGYLAPTATNSQRVGFTLVTDPQAVYNISKFTHECFAKSLKLLTNPLIKPFAKMAISDYNKYVPMFKSMTRGFASGDDRVLRGATSILLIHTPVEYRWGAEDANLAYQNASLMAESLGIGQFYTGFVITAVRQQKGQLEKMLGIKGRIFAGMAMGMPKLQYSKYVEREDIKLEII